MTNLIVAMILLAGIFMAAALLSLSTFGPQAEVSEAMKKIEKTVALIAEDTVSVFARIVKELEKLRKRVWDLEQDMADVREARKKETDDGQ